MSVLQSTLEQQNSLDVVPSLTETEQNRVHYYNAGNTELSGDDVSVS
ncbi:hypothetical protein [Aliivibrio fischeri]|nr:hypothetical protein [Aliivibrio fischeri]